MENGPYNKPQNSDNRPEVIKGDLEEEKRKRLEGTSE